MDRDAPKPPVDVLPPIAWETARKVGLAGAAMAAAAAALGLVATILGDPPWLIHTARLLLVFIGAIAAGLAITFRADLWQMWAIGAATALLAVFGTPAHWDSFQLLFGVLAVVAVARAGLVVVPPVWRIRVVSAAIVLHFGGIFLATTAPSPTPWIVDQAYQRVYEPYLHFIYLRNAYHFYSPEPGPASLMICLLKTEIGDDVSADGVKHKKYKMEWLVVPRRPADIRDPLGVTYFRRLSLTDQIGHGYADLVNASSLERSEIRRRRGELNVPGTPGFIPMHPLEIPDGQHRQPDPVVSRYILPSYAQHILMDLPEAERGKTTVKIYRAVHETLAVQGLVGVPPADKPGDPYHPTTYRPTFLGEFRFVPNPADPAKPRVELVDSREPMLYWLLPILPQATGGDPSRKDYIDYMAIHAGREFDWSLLR